MPQASSDSERDLLAGWEVKYSPNRAELSLDGLASCLAKLGCYYATGEGLVRDISKSVQILRSAVALEDPSDADSWEWLAFVV